MTGSDGEDYSYSVRVDADGSAVQTGYTGDGAYLDALSIDGESWGSYEC